MKIENKLDEVIERIKSDTSGKVEYTKTTRKCD